MRNGSNEIQVNYKTNFPVTRIETISKGVLNYEKVGFVENIDDSYKLKKGDILLSNINSLKYIGNCVYFDDNKILYHGMNLILIRFKEEFNKKFLFFFMKYYNNWFKKMACQAVNQASINQESLKKFPFKIPLFIEQEKIADFLSLVDKKIELMEKKYKLLENYKNGIMNLIFRKKVFFEDLNSWKLKKIKEIGNISTGNTPSTKNKEFYHPETYLWVTPSDITKSKYITNTARKLSIEGSKKGKFVEKNSVLVTCIASIGKNCIIPVNGYFNQQINSITPNEENNSDFIYYLISFNAKKMKQYAGITATPILNKKDFENMYFEFPPLKEQEKIADFLSENDNKIDYVEQQLEKTKEFKKYLLQQMFV